MRTTDVPCWRTGAFAGEFGDPFIKNTNLEGGYIAPAIDVLVKSAKETLKKRSPAYFGFSDDDAVVLETVCKDLEGAAAMSRDLDSKGYHQLNDFLANFVNKIRELQEGERFLFGGGWQSPTSGHAIMHAIQREKGSEKDVTFSFTTLNTGSGIQFHPSNQADYPKRKVRTAITIGSIPLKRMCDEAVWYVLFKQMTLSRKENGPAIVYQVVLPHLVGPNKSVLQAIKDTGDARSGDLETPQRSGTCYYRCVLCAFKYLLKRDGFDRTMRKRATYFLRRAFLDATERDLRTIDPKTFTVSDLFMIRIACGQTSLSAAKLGKLGLSVDKMKDVRGQVQSMLSFAAGLEPKEYLAIENAPLNLQGHTKLHPFVGFDCLAACEKSVEHFAGTLTEAVPEMFVDLQPLTIGGASEKSAFRHRLVRVVTHINEQCDKLRARSSVTAISLSTHQICALIEHNFTGGIVPLPSIPGMTDDPDDMWVRARNEGVRNADRKCALQCLYKIAQHYVAASYSLSSDHAQYSSRAITMSAIMITFDATLRLRTRDEPSLLSNFMSGRVVTAFSKKATSSETSKQNETINSAKSRVTVARDAVHFLEVMSETEKGTVVVIEFHNSSHNDDRLDRLSTTFPSVVFLKISSSVRDLCANFNITSYPTLILKKNDVELERVVSKTSIADIARMVRKHLTKVPASDMDDDGATATGDRDNEKTSSDAKAGESSTTVVNNNEAGNEIPLNMDAFNGSSFRELSETMILHDPNLTRARATIISWIERLVPDVNDEVSLGDNDEGDDATKDEKENRKVSAEDAAKEAKKNQALMNKIKNLQSPRAVKLENIAGHAGKLPFFRSRLPHIVLLVVFSS